VESTGVGIVRSTDVAHRADASITWKDEFAGKGPVVTVYVCPYMVGPPETLSSPRHPTALSEDFVEALGRREWPYDLGDDPSFYCSRRFATEGAALSWGICRRNVRTLVEQGDTVAFFGVESHDGGKDYRFSAFATVAKTVSQLDIWTNDDLAIYRRYLNLLIVPDGKAYAHREAQPGNQHENWLWRMTTSRGKSWRSKDFDAFKDPHCTMSFRPGIDRAANGEPIQLAPNYILFSTDPTETFVASDPPVVASVEPNKSDWRERWVGTAVAQGIHALTVGARPRRTTLRTARRWNQHPHMRLDRDAAAWRTDMLALLDRCGVTSVGASRPDRTNEHV
jgi:hypothetical protein